MSKKLILKLRKDRDEARAGAEALLAKMEQGTDLSESEQTNLEALTAEATGLDERIRELTEMETARIEALNLDARFDSLTRETSSFDVSDRPTDPGSAFTASDAFRNYASAPSGNSAVFTAEARLTNLAVATAVVTGNLPPKNRARDVEAAVQRNTLLDVIGYEPVSSNALEWIEWPIDPVAGVVAENATKAEATYTPALKTGSLEKIAHHLPFTREVLEDVPRFQSMVNGALLRGVRRKAETQAAAALVSATLPAETGETLTEAIRMGQAKVETAGYWADTCVVNPYDAATIDLDLLKATVDGAVRRASAWNLQILTATSVTAGTAYVGDFEEAMRLFDRQNLAIYLTDSHASEFTDNVLRALAEARMKAVVVQPNALCEVTVDAP